ncbi:cell division FtsI/penicillin-binding 2 domain protein [[Clostridium] sordellii ATCC 9714]|nr:cell division FtsI/penicillin-binding 2 domain protein [[Clostridium] sordellii ATCC 9714] [Paeniclostridium sordellii ATCC 9714]
MGSYGVSKDEAVKLAEKYQKEANQKAKKEFEAQQKAKKEKKEKEDKKLFGKDKKEEKETEAEFVPDNSEATKVRYLRKAIKELNPKLTDDQIDSYKQNYPSFAWSVGFAPADNPEIAVVTVLPKGESSSLALLPVREIMGEYFGLTKKHKEEAENTNKTGENANKEAEAVKPKGENEMNFASQVKK